MGGKAHLKLWVKLGCSPRYTQMVPKWHLAGQLAGTDAFNTRARCNSQTSFRFPWSEFGWIRLAENWVKSTLEFMGHAGVLWPEMIFSTCTHGVTYQKVSVFARSEFGCIWLAEKWVKQYA